MATRVYTTGSRVKDKKLCEFLNDYVTEFSSMERRMWHDMTDPAYNDDNQSAYITGFCNKYGILKRTANSIRSEIKGRKKALLELKKTELQQTIIKLQDLIEKIEKIKNKLNELKVKAIANTISDEELKEYKKLKASLYWKKNKLNKFAQKKINLEYQINNKICKMCYGSKKEFNKQYNLSANGCSTHEKWHNDFVKARDKNIFYLGSSDEANGNQMCQLTYNKKTDSFDLAVRKAYKNSIEYVYCTGIKIKHLKNDVIEALKNKKSISIRFHRTGNKWYMQVIFKKTHSIYTRCNHGTIGIDYNDGFLEVSETNEDGNLIYQTHIELEHHGTGNKAKSELEEKISMLVKYAAYKGKDIVAEKLDFKRTKANQNKATNDKGKNYNRMLHAFDYNRYMQLLSDIGFNNNVYVNFVNPKNTSKIGKEKYSKLKKLNTHQAASYVIARKGQGFVDKLK